MSVDNRLRYTLITEKYRPHILDEIVLPDELTALFSKMIDEKEVPNMLFYSNSPGVGKSTTAKVLAYQCDYEYLYINNSLERGIDVLRSRIMKFATTLSFDGRKKLVILDEFDGTTRELQDALRASIEEFHDSCRFICTCNYLTKISTPLQSRLQVINFDFSEASVRKQVLTKMGLRILDIMKKENFEYDKKETIGNILKSFYPDFRKMLLLIKQCNDQYGIVSNNIFKIESIEDKFYDYILKKEFTNARTYVIENNVNLDEVYTLIKKNVLDKHLIKDKIVRGELYITLSDYDYRSKFVTDKELNFAACLMEMFKEM